MKETLKNLRVMFKKVIDNADKEILDINDKIEELNNKKADIEFTRNKLLDEIRKEIEEATVKEYKKLLLK